MLIALAGRMYGFGLVGLIPIALFRPLPPLLSPVPPLALVLPPLNEAALLLPHVSGVKRDKLDGCWRT